MASSNYHYVIGWLEKNGATLTVTNPLQALALTFHAVLSQHGFVSVIETSSTIVGFAPSIRELPANQFIDPRWNMDQTTTTLMYKHKSKLGKIFTLVLISFDENVIATLSQRNGDSYSVELDTKVYWENPPSNLHFSQGLRNVDQLVQKIERIASNLIPSVISDTERSTALNSLNENRGQDSLVIGSSRFVPSATPTGVSIVGVGDNDLDPFNGTVFPKIIPTISRPQGGTYVGPDHPIFQQNPFQQDGVPTPSVFFPNPSYLPPEFDLPVPRFDPLGPVGPNQGFGNYSKGRGRGRIPPFSSLFPGEPNPDHLNPPGW